MMADAATFRSARVQTCQSHRSRRRRKNTEPQKTRERPCCICAACDACCLHRRVPRGTAGPRRRRGPLHRRAANGADPHRPETVRGPGSDRAQAERPAARPIRGEAQHLCFGDVPPQFRGGWKMDKTVRDTGPFIATLGDGGWSGSYNGTHAPVLVWYSPEMIAWLRVNRPAIRRRPRRIPRRSRTARSW